MNHYFVIRSAYSPDYPIEQNEHRLTLTERFCVPSLAAQTRQDFIVELITHPLDPLLERRINAFSKAGLSVVNMRTHGRHIRTRFDDDDAIAVDFVERVRDGIAGDGWYSFESGYVLYKDVVFPRLYRSNQFLTRVGERGVFELMHSDVKNPTILDNRPAWLWVRHDLNRSPENTVAINGKPVFKKELAEVFACELR